jgi:hypothetical protein
MKHIRRKKVDLGQMEYWHHDAGENLADALTKLPTTPGYADTVVTHAFRRYFTSFLFEPDPIAQARYLRIYIESYLAVHHLRAHIGEEVVFEVDGQESRGLVVDRSYSLSIGRWRDLFWAAYLLGDRALLDRVTNLSLDWVTEVSTTRSEAYCGLFAIFLQKWYRREGDVSHDLLAATKSANTVRTTSPVYSYMLDVGTPPIEMFGSILYRDEARLEEQLLRGLEGHKREVKDGSKKGIQDFVGIVSLPLSAVTRIARRRSRRNLRRGGSGRGLSLPTVVCRVFPRRAARGGAFRYHRGGG